MSRTQTEVSTLPMGHDASQTWPQHTSQSTTRSRHSSRSMASVADAMLNFGNQMTSSLMHLADQYRNDAIEREKMALAREQIQAEKQKQEEDRNLQREQCARQEALRREEMVRQETARQVELIKKESLEKEKLVAAKEQAMLRAQREEQERIGTTVENGAISKERETRTFGSSRK